MGRGLLASEVSQLSNSNILYTSIIGKYDSLKEPTIKTKGWDYVCYTNEPSITSDFWQIKPIPSRYQNIPDPKRIASLLKIEHYNVVEEDYNTIIYVDGAVKVNVDLNKFLEFHNFGDYDFGIPTHLSRNCLYEEAEICKSLDDPALIDQQVQRYREAGYPRQNGLWATTGMIKNNKSSALKKACEIWSEEYTLGCKRDQVSLNYAFWKASNLGHIFRVKNMAWGATSAFSFGMEGAFSSHPHL